MSLTNDDYSKISFFSALNIDKIVGVWEGSFEKGNAVLRTGDVTNLYLYSIPHGFTRPLFVDLLWSDDNVTWADAGGSLGSEFSTAFSDSTNIYIISSIGSSATGTRYYKAIGFWIDTYDATNPLVPSFHAQEQPVLFDSRVNYQKIHTEGSTTYSAGTFGAAQTVTVNHTLGYAPNSRGWFESISGEVWPMHKGGASNPFNYSFAQDEALIKIYSDRIDIEVNKFSNATRKIWYKIYVDA